MVGGRQARGPSDKLLGLWGLPRQGAWAARVGQSSCPRVPAAPPLRSACPAHPFPCVTPARGRWRLEGGSQTRQGTRPEGASSRMQASRRQQAPRAPPAAGAFVWLAAWHCDPWSRGPGCCCAPLAWQARALSARPRPAAGDAPRRAAAAPTLQLSWHPAAPAARWFPRPPGAGLAGWKPQRSAGWPALACRGGARCRHRAQTAHRAQSCAATTG